MSYPNIPDKIYINKHSFETLQSKNLQHIADFKAIEKDLTQALNEAERLYTNEEEWKEVYRNIRKVQVQLIMGEL